MKKREPCPSCGSDDTARIIYDFTETSDDSKSEWFGSGSEVIGASDPHRACNSCAAPFFPDGRYLDRWEDEIFETVVLVRSTSPEVDIRVQAEIGEDETLRIAGHERGPGVLLVWGADYEYWLSFKSSDLTRIAMAVLQALAYLPSALIDFLRRYAISYEFEGEEPSAVMVGLVEREDRLAVMLHRSNRFELRRLCLLGLRELFAVRGWETTDELQALFGERGIPYKGEPPEHETGSKDSPDPFGGSDPPG